MHSTSGQLADIPVEEGCFIHHCTPCYVEKADALGFPRERQFIIPQFLFFEEIPPLVPNEGRALVRRELGLPEDRPIILSVGSLDRSVKRMDYVIRETAKYARTGAKPLLVMLGQIDPETPAVQDLAERELGADAFVMKTVSRAQLWKFYQAADVFVLASLREGFGFVYVEALATGLPVIAHDFDVSRYVLGQNGIFGDLEQAGVLSNLLERSLHHPKSDAERRALREYVRERFDWSSVASDYIEMFEAAASSSDRRGARA
ncbi:MAG: glycosyltransferase family 4 protein [Gemmatimonadaceae bacterium]